MQGRSKPAFETQHSSSRVSSKSQSASATKKQSELWHMKRGTHSEKRTTTSGYLNDADDPSVKECNNDDVGRSH